MGEVERKAVGREGTQCCYMNSSRFSLMGEAHTVLQVGAWLILTAQLKPHSACRDANNEHPLESALKNAVTGRQAINRPTAKLFFVNILLSAVSRKLVY